MLKAKKRGLFLGPFFFKTDAAGRLFILIFIQQKTDVGTFLSRDIPEMESRINKLANITDNRPQRPSETTWSLPIMMLRNWKSVFFSFSFSESNKKKSNTGLLKQMRLCPRNNPLFLFSLIFVYSQYTNF